MSNNPFTVETKLDAEGILRWTTNDACVPMECLDAHAPAGYDRTKHEAAIEKDNEVFFAIYRANPPRRSSEELAEIRNEIGLDAIDIITGKRIFA